jgi:hypothetical protein
MADTTRDIELRLRARDLSTAELKSVIQQVNELSSALDRQLQAASRLEVKEKELRATLQQFDQAARNVVGLDATIQRYKALSEQVTRNEADLKKAQDALAAHSAAMSAGTATGRAAEASLSGFEKAVLRAQQRLDTNRASMERYNASLQQAGIDTANLVSAEQQLIAVADQIGNSRTKLNTTIQNYARFEREAKEAAKATAQAQREAAEAAQAEANAVAQVNARRREEANALRSMLSDRMRASRDQTKQLEDFNNETRRLSQERKNREEQAARETIAATRREYTERRRAQEQFVESNRQSQERFNAETRRQSQQRQNDERLALRQRLNDIRQGETEERRIRLAPQPGGTPAPGGGVLGTGGARGNRQVPGFLGLRPYELTNLGYQVNDVIGGLLQGQNVTQILAQQGGQFIQIFGRAALRWFPLVAIAIAGVSIAAEALNAHLRELSSNREFTALLTTNKYAADQSAASLTALRKEIRDYGVSWEDAGKAIKVALDANVRPERIREVTLVARAMARVLGIELPEATKDLVEGLNGGIAGFDKLVEKYPAISAENAKYIRSLFASNQTQKAAIEILRLLGDEYRKAEQEKLSPFERTTEKLGAAWNRLIDTLGNSKAFDYLITKVTSLVEWITRGVEATDRLLEKMKDPRFAAGVATATGLLPAQTGARPGTALGFFSGLGEQAGAWVRRQFEATPVATGAIEGTRFSTSGLKVDTEELRTLIALLAEASRALPPGYRAEAISTERPGARVRGTGEPSEHGFGRALDVRVVDDKGQPVPGYMGPGGPVYDVLDKAVATLAAARGLEVAIGSTFGKPDAGHYSIGGREAARTAGRITPDGSAAMGPGVFGGPTAGQESAGARENRLLQDRLNLSRVASEAEEKRLIETTRRIGLEQQGVKGAAQDAAIKKEIALFEDERNRINYEHAQERARQAQQDGRDRAAIEEAGQKAVNDAIKHGITNYKQLYDIRIKGEGEARAEIQKTKQEQDQLDAAEKRVGELRRQHLSEHKSALDRINEATNVRYDAEIKALDKLIERQSKTDQDKLKALREELELLRQQELQRNVLKSAEAQANEALATRRDLIQTYNKLESVGELTITEKERLTKEAFDLTRKSILDAADAIEKYLQSTEGMKETPERIALLTAKVKELRAETKYIDPFWKGLKDTFTQSFSTAGETFFNSVSESIGGAIAKTKEWKDVWSGLKNAAANFFAQILKDIANYIIKAQLAKLASSLLGGTSFGNFLGIAQPAATTAATTAATAGTSAAATTSTGLFGLGFLGLHGGGVVGRVPEKGRAPASWWAGAPRYHSGTLVGIAPDEQAAILRRGEEVLSADNPRNILNGGGGGDVNFRAVLVDDTRRIPEAMAGAHGEKVIVQTLVRNAATIRELVRG